MNMTEKVKSEAVSEFGDIAIENIKVEREEFDCHKQAVQDFDSSSKVSLLCVFIHWGL